MTNLEWKNFKETSSASCWKLRVTEGPELLWTPLPSQDKTKENYFPVENATGHSCQPDMLPPWHAALAVQSVVQEHCAEHIWEFGLLQWLFFHNQLAQKLLHIQHGASSMRSSPSTWWCLGKQLGPGCFSRFQLCPVTIPVWECWRYLGSAAMDKPGNLTRETGHKCSKCFPASLRHSSVFHQRRTSWEQ